MTWKLWQAPMRCEDDPVPADWFQGPIMVVYREGPSMYSSYAKQADWCVKCDGQVIHSHDKLFFMTMEDVHHYATAKAIQMTTDSM